MYLQIDSLYSFNSCLSSRADRILLSLGSLTDSLFYSSLSFLLNSCSLCFLGSLMVSLLLSNSSFHSKAFRLFSGFCFFSLLLCNSVVLPCGLVRDTVGLFLSNSSFYGKAFLLQSLLLSY